MYLHHKPLLSYYCPNHVIHVFKSWIHIFELECRFAKDKAHNLRRKETACYLTAPAISNKREGMQYARPRAYLAASYFTYHGTGWHRVPFQPERDEGRGHQNYSRDKYSSKVERSVSCKY